MLGAPVPILRSFDAARTKAFYLGFLGFEPVFEHRFEPDMPLYMGVRRGECVLHLTEHHGDGTPGAAVRIACDDVSAFVASLPTDYPYARPGPPERTPWGSHEITILDPAANRLTFHSDAAHG